MIKVYAPASIGNISVGFDILGIAISPIDGSLLGDSITIESNINSFNLETTGRFSNQLSENIENNIVYQCWKNFCEVIQQKIYVNIKLEKNMPIGSGLGSSACSIVAALVALNVFCDYPLKNDVMLKLMGKMESFLTGDIHFDNVAPCFFGGMQLLLMNSEYNNINSQKIPYFTDWLWIVAYPGIKLSTARARAILPLKYSREDCIKYGQYLAGFLHACYTNNSILAIQSMKDVIAEPYRAQLLPGFIKARQIINELGGLTCGISGSGPTLFAISDNQSIAIEIANWLSTNYLQHHDGFVHICRINEYGVRIIME